MPIEPPGTTGRRRQNSSASATWTLPQRPKTTTGGRGGAVQPGSAHVSDPFLHDFLQPVFDPAAYWNATLGSGSGNNGGGGSSSSSSRTRTGGTSKTTATTTTTADQAALAQTTLSQLAAHTTRLTAVLTQLTDDILRSGSRLTYEVELLRGETIGLAEVLEQVSEAMPGAKTEAEVEPKTKAEADGAAADEEVPSDKDLTPPSALAQLRMLAQVRARLDAVIRTFGDAMEFVMPPSALSVSASFLSVSGPETAGGQDAGSGSAGARSGAGATTSLEDKGQHQLRTRRDEVAQLLQGDNADNIEEAAARVAALRALCQVWAGTAEEKARAKFVDGLQRMVDERQKQREREREKQAAEQTTTATSSGPTASTASGTASGTATTDGTSTAASTQDASNPSAAAAAINRGYTSGYGFISQLQKIRGGL